MGSLLSWQLVIVFILFLIGFASFTDPALTETREIQPPPTKLSSMQYESVCVNIYDSQTPNTEKTYYYSPIAVLNPLSAIHISSKIPTQGSLSIAFSIWNEDVGIKVAQHLTQVLNQNVEPNQVQVFPFDSARMKSNVQYDFSLTNEWQTYKTQQQQLRFPVNCPTREDCDRMKSEMRLHPKQFQHLQLEFIPQFLNDDTCNYHGEGTSQDVLSIQLRELTKSLEETKWNFTYELTKAKQESVNLAKELKAFREVAQKELDSTRIELNNTKSIVDDLMLKLHDDKTSEIVDIGQMPTSCSDLQQMGHKLSGFFSVKGSKKMEMIYCDFRPNQNDKQKWIGYADVKSEPVHFYVQRKGNFATTGKIPFDLAVVNEGNAMDFTSGIFTAPRPGIYFFSFTAMAHFPASSLSKVHLGVGLHLNGGRIGSGEVGEENIHIYKNRPLTLQMTLNLKKGDQVWLEITGMSSGAYFHDNHDDNNNHHTHFTGFMLEEEIVASI